MVALHDGTVGRVVRMVGDLEAVRGHSKLSAALILDERALHPFYVCIRELIFDWPGAAHDTTRRAAGALVVPALVPLACASTAGHVTPAGNIAVANSAVHHATVGVGIMTSGATAPDVVLARCFAVPTPA